MMKNILVVIAKEVREALPAMIFFLLVFHMIAVTKAVILTDYDISAASATIATVAALIVAKAILVVEKLPVARCFSHRLLLNVIWKTLLFGVVALLFRLIEESISQAAEHGGLPGAVRHLFQNTAWPHFWVVQMWLFGCLFLYCLATELVRIIGADRVKDMLWKSNRNVSAP